MGNEIAKIGIEDEQLASRFQLEVGGDRVELYRRLQLLTDRVNEVFTSTNQSVGTFLTVAQYHQRYFNSYGRQDTYFIESLQGNRFIGMEVRAALEGKKCHPSFEQLVETTLTGCLAEIKVSQNLAGDTSGAGGSLGLG